MTDFLKYLLSQITEKDGVHIDEVDDEGNKVYSIFVDDADYPTIIGKRGLTIKAITALCRIKARTQDSLGGERFFIKVNSNSSP